MKNPIVLLAITNAYIEEICLKNIKAGISQVS